MKKMFLLAVMAIVSVSAFAQFKSVEAKLDLRGETGFGVGAVYGLNEKIEVAPSFSLFFPGNDASLFSFDVNAHYLLPEFVEKLELYPIAGLGMLHSGYEYVTTTFNEQTLKLESNKVEAKDNLFLVNIGAGARWNFNDQFYGLVEEKYQIVKDMNDNFLTIGFGYKF